MQGGVTPGGPGPTGTSLASIPGTGSVQKINKIRRVFTIIRNFCVDVSPSAGEVATKFICSLVVRAFTTHTSVVMHASNEPAFELNI